jgi:hypothetical protein
MKPRYGWVHGHAVHASVWDHLPRGTSAERFNARLAILVTKAVGSMWCAYAFALFDLISLPAAISGGAATFVSWVAQTFLQLVLLSIIMVGQDVQAKASDARAAKTFQDVETVLDRLDIKTQGGLQTVLAAVESLKGT